MQFLTDILDKGTLIPDNATNGDIIKAMFSDSVWQTNEDGEVYLNRVASKCEGVIVSIPLDWWNAPYKK